MQTREALVAAGVALLEQDGLNALSLRRIASDAQVSHGAPRRYFPTYGALLAAIARSGVDDLDRALAPSWEVANPREAIGRVAQGYLGFALARPEMFSLIFRHDLLEGQGGNLREVTAVWFQRLAELVSIVAGDDDPHRVAAIWSGVHGVAVLHARRATDIPQAALDPSRTLSVLLEGLLA